MPDISPAYRPRKPKDSPYYRCVEDHFEEFEQVYDDRFTVKYGFFRAYVNQVIYRFKACPGLRSGNGKKENIFDALEWLAAMSSHAPNKGERMVHYYGLYSNVRRGKRKRQARPQFTHASGNQTPTTLRDEGNVDIQREIR